MYDLKIKSKYCIEFLSNTPDLTLKWNRWESEIQFISLKENILKTVFNLKTSVWSIYQTSMIDLMWISCSPNSIWQDYRNTFICTWWCDCVFCVSVLSLQSRDVVADRRLCWWVMWICRCQRYFIIPHPKEQQSDRRFCSTIGQINAELSNYERAEVSHSIPYVYIHSSHALLW